MFSKILNLIELLEEISRCTAMRSIKETFETVVQGFKYHSLPFLEVTIGLGRR